MDIKDKKSIFMVVALLISAVFYISSGKVMERKAEQISENIEKYSLNEMKPRKSTKSSSKDMLVYSRISALVNEDYPMKIERKTDDTSSGYIVSYNSVEPNINKIDSILNRYKGELSISSIYIEESSGIFRNRIDLNSR